jgi:hypothetical protein
MRRTSTLSTAILAVVFFSALIPGSTSGQDKSTTPAVEYKAVLFATDEREATRKLNELAAQGWEYVGPLGNSLVAFKRVGGKEGTKVADKPKDAEAELLAGVLKLGGQFKRSPSGKDKLLWVDLKGTKTTDADLAALGDLPGVYDLDLSFTGITDKAIARLARCKELRGLNLAGTKVTDAAIADLRKIPDLHTINLGATAVTPDGIARLVEGRSCDVCPVALGDKAHFRVFQEFRLGELQYNYLMINDTYYGRYYVGPFAELPDAKPEDHRRLATTYYHRDGPVGAVISKLEWFTPAGLLDYPSDARLPASLAGLFAASDPRVALTAHCSEPAIGVVRLNVGTEAAYGRPFQQVHFYNSTPELKEFIAPKAGHPVYFGFVPDAQKRGCNVQIIDGPERQSFAKKSPRDYYSALFVDVTRNDLRDINTDLFTRESVADMMASMTETGVLCFHTSHRYHNLVPPLVDAAASLKLSWKVGKDFNFEKGRSGHFSSEWVMIARKPAYLEHLTDVNTKDRRIEWTTPKSSGRHVWHDGQEHDLEPLARQK